MTSLLFTITEPSADLVIVTIIFNDFAYSTAVEYAKSLNMIVTITRSADGSVIVNNNEVININPVQVDKVVDTTGAGDLYAGGFLFGMAKGKDLATCGNYASIAAAEIISHYGARPLVKLSNLI